MSLFKNWPSLTELFFGKKEAESMAKKVAPTIATKPKATPKATAAPKPRGTNKDLKSQEMLKKARSEASTKKPTKKELAKMTKVELEAKGRTVGIELDRRETKDKLVKALHKVL
jgi:hypothetical protein